jgi:alkyl hydroperoxide reductase subunit AhpF
MTELLNAEIQRQVREAFSGMKEPVHLIFFGSSEPCEYCEDTRQLAQEVAHLSDKLSLGIHDLQADSALAAQYHADKAPTLVIAGRDGDTITDFHIRLSGIPAGHEFASLIQGILLVSSRDSGLSPASREYLKGITSPVQLQVFVTPT